MNKNEKFVLTEFWSKKLKGDLRSFYKTIYFGPPVFMLLNVMFCFALQKGTDIGFWVLYMPITILSTIYCLLIPRKAIKRYSNIILKIEFKNDTELRLTSIDGKELVISNPEFQNDFFKVDNAEKTCKSLVINSDHYTIIPDFFSCLPIL